MSEFKVARSRMAYKGLKKNRIFATHHYYQIITHVLKEPLPNDEEDHRYVYDDGGVNGYVDATEHRYEISRDWYNVETKEVVSEEPVMVATLFDPLNRVFIIFTKGGQNIPIRVDSEANTGLYRKSHTPDELRDFNGIQEYDTLYTIGFFDNSIPHIDLEVLMDKGQYYRRYNEEFEYDEEEDIPADLSMYKRVEIVVSDYKRHPSYRNHYFNVEDK